MNERLNFRAERTETIWGEDGNAFPSQILLDGVPVLRPGTTWLSCRLSDGRRAVPYISERTIVEPVRHPGRLWINMDLLNWRDEAGNDIPDFRTDLRFELWDDGTAFVSFYFMGESCDVPDIDSFTFEVRPDVSGFEHVKWGVVRRCATTNAADILPVRAERFLDPGEERRDDGSLMASVSFNCFTPNRTARYMEFFVEGHSTLSGLIDGCSSSMTWEDGQPVARWDFQKPAYRHHAERPWQLRNQIGWLVTPPPTKRALPPLRMYHYFSNQHRYPSPDCVRKMAAAGADVVTFHENWRSDTINGGTPYNPLELRALVAAAHEAGMRVALYVRGNEQAEVEEKTDWFPRFLKRDHDGLYMDSGGADSCHTPKHIDYVGGRIHFRGWYLAARERRERVGKYGLVFSHSGTTFSAIGATDGLLTGQVTGEGERGLMIKSREHHAYFSCSRILPGTMWTAAFPEYGTSAMVPYLASTGQYPHVALGAQFETSSLKHPDEPGTSDRHLRPLWRLWGLFSGERDIGVGTWDNGFAGVATDSDRTGFYAMRAGDGALLVIVTNFEPGRRTARIALDYAALALPESLKAYRLTPDLASPGVAAEVSKDGAFDFDLDGHGVAGLLFAPADDKWAARLAAFAKPYPEPDAFDKAWLDMIARQKALRDNPPAWKKVWMRVSVPNLSTPYEESLWWDLFAVHVALCEKDAGADAGYREIGWIAPDSAKLLSERPALDPKVPPVFGCNDAGIIWPGHPTPWIPLHETLGPGLHELATRSVIATLGISFYSWIEITLSPEPAPKAEGAYTLIFLNDLEPDRESIRWKTFIAPAAQ